MPEHWSCNNQTLPLNAEPHNNIASCYVAGTSILGIVYFLPAKLMAYQYILPVATVSACLHIMHNFHVSIHIKRLNGLCCECWNGQSQWGSTFGLTLFQDWEWAQVYELSENALCATKSYRLVAASAAMQTTLHWSSEALPTDMLIAGGRW